MTFRAICTDGSAVLIRSQEDALGLCGRRVILPADGLCPREEGTIIGVDIMSWGVSLGICLDEQYTYKYAGDLFYDDGIREVNLYQAVIVSKEPPVGELQRLLEAVFVGAALSCTKFTVDVGYDSNQRPTVYRAVRQDIPR